MDVGVEELLLFLFIIFFRIHWMISFRFVSFFSLQILFRFVVFRFISLCFISFRCVSFLTLQGPQKIWKIQFKQMFY